MNTKSRAYTSQPGAAPAQKTAPAAKGKEHTRQRECVPCDIPPFCRTNYFTGRLLTEHDFTSEQQYYRDKFRLHYRAVHGWGVVCGLRVKPHPYCPHLRLIVEPGIAIDRCGYEIVVPREVEIELPRKPDPQAASPGATGAYGQTPYQEASPPGMYIPAYVCLEYAECDTDFMPAPFDECGCNGQDGRQPGRVCETYSLTVRQGHPPTAHEAVQGSCEDIWHDSLDACPAPTKGDCIPLALLTRYTPGETVTEDGLDNWCRALLPSPRIHDRVLRCILARIPADTLTRVSAMGWTHAYEYTCADFIRFYTGQSEGGPAFEVTFEQPVRRECLTPRTFQAVITRFRGQPPTALEIAPSRVWSNNEGTSYYLQIDRAYAERELRNTWFDVYLTLRCNLVVDTQGRPVDGELLARLQENDYVVSPPTGDGMPGGTLESWIRVRP
jgi:hypothetical protein